jgi:predicted nucleic-acid-binding protein
MIALDTNILVRYFAQDDPVQAALATAFIETQISDQVPGFVSIITLAELVWVLGRQYHVSIDTIKMAVAGLLAAPNIVIEHSEMVEGAMRLSHFDLSDTFIHLIGRANGCTKTVTFDKKFAQLEGVELLS